MLKVPCWKFSCEILCKRKVTASFSAQGNPKYFEKSGNTNFEHNSNWNKYQLQRKQSEKIQRKGKTLDSSLQLSFSRHSIGDRKRWIRRYLASSSIFRYCSNNIAWLVLSGRNREWLRSGLWHDYTLIINSIGYPLVPLPRALALDKESPIRKMAKDHIGEETDILCISLSP